jgi:hypothetical protein
MAPIRNGVPLALLLVAVPPADALLELDDEDEQPATASAAKAIAAADVPVALRPALPKNRVIFASFLPGTGRPAPGSVI